MSAAAIAPMALQRTATPSAAPASPSTGKSWLFGPWLDLLFIANVAWPFLLLAGLTGGVAKGRPISFWMVYFIATPHRWITLVLVFFDPDRFQQNARAFLGLAAAAALACVGSYLIWGLPGVYALLAVDFLWNAWHFASQHAGILRIYRRNVAGNQAGSGTVEKLLVRAFLLFVFLRLASLTLPMEERFGSYLEQLKAVSTHLSLLDLPILLVPVGLLVRELAWLRPVSYGRLAYLVSVCTLYSLLLGSVHAHYVSGDGSTAAVVMALAAAVSVFHSSEYFAVVSWAATRKRNPRGILGYLAPRWIATLAIFLTLMAVTALVMDTWFAGVWLVINLIVSFLHYAYDGIIWKSRKASTPAPKTTDQ